MNFYYVKKGESQDFKDKDIELQLEQPISLLNSAGSKCRPHCGKLFCERRCEV